jgi:hypothetical protein
MRTAALVAFLLWASPASAQGTSVIAGCVTGDGSPLPAATITIMAPGTRIMLQADQQGCYQMSVPAGRYRITARLTGFDNVTRDRVRVAAGQLVRVDLATRLSAICECFTTPTTLRHLFAFADAVAYLRILNIETLLPPRHALFTQTAQVIEVLKIHDAMSSRGSTLTFSQEQVSGTPEPYVPGEEYVLFLRWWPTERMLVATSNFHEGNHTATMFVVEGGIVTRSPPSLAQFTGKPVEFLLAELRRIAGDK